MRELFIDASRGLAGDMLCASLLGLFNEPEDMAAQLNALRVPGVTYRLEEASRYSISGFHLAVDYLGREEDGTDAHTHRGLGDIRQIVCGLSMPDRLKTQVMEIYGLIAEAEAKVHGRPVQLVHFHELGAMDAVADIAAACLLIDALAPERITVSPVCTGFGSVQTAHGLLPVPAPATAQLLKNVPCLAGQIEGELCTPTGAALVKYFTDGFSRMPLMTVRAEGYGLGRRDFGSLSCVRAILGEREEHMIELCCNVDDMSPEAVGFALDELLRAGAPDAWYEPIGMKKNRPGLLLCCLCSEEQRDEMLRLLFRHTSTIGIRETLCRRYVLKRQRVLVDTAYGPVGLKISDGYGVERRKAEFDDLARIARDQSLSLAEAEELLRER